jgi:hypothetical protein
MRVGGEGDRHHDGRHLVRRLLDVGTPVAQDIVDLLEWVERRREADDGAEWLQCERE